MKLMAEQLAEIRSHIDKNSWTAGSIADQLVQHIDALEAELSRWQAVAGKLALGLSTHGHGYAVDCDLCQAIREYESLTAGQKGSE